jgi:hypothetical protein
MPTPTNQSPFVSYPFQLHATQQIPWNIEISQYALVLRSHRCSQLRTTTASPSSAHQQPLACVDCSSIEHHVIFGGIMERNLHGAPQKLNYKFLTGSHTEDLLKRKNDHIKQLRLSGLNLARDLSTRTRVCDSYKRFLIAIGQQDIPRLKTLVSVACREGASISLILERINDAINDIYHPRSYTDQDFQRQYLFLTLGGHAVAHLAQKTLGLPSITTTRRHMGSNSFITPSHFTPVVSEMTANLEVSHLPTTPLLSEVVIGLQIGIDEIKTESRLRWDPRSNYILGVCRDHSQHSVLQFKTIVQAEAVINQLKQGQIHYATEGR